MSRTHYVTPLSPNRVRLAYVVTTLRDHGFTWDYILASIAHPMSRGTVQNLYKFGKALEADPDTDPRVIYSRLTNPRYKPSTQDEAVPTCDICGVPEELSPLTWNGETGLHHYCEERYMTCPTCNGAGATGVNGPDPDSCSSCRGKGWVHRDA